MKTYVTESSFINEMIKEGNGFTYNGAKLLFDYLEGFGDDIEFDPIAFRCEFNEYCVGDYTNDYKNVYNDFIDFLYNNDYINGNEYNTMHDDDIYRIGNKFNANNYDNNILEDFYNEVVIYDENFCNGKNYDCFIVRNY